MYQKLELFCFSHSKFGLDSLFDLEFQFPRVFLLYLLFDCLLYDSMGACFPFIDAHYVADFFVFVFSDKDLKWGKQNLR